MIIQCIPIKVTEQEAMKIAEGGGNVIGKALYGNGKITLKVMYLEHRKIVYEMTYHDNLLYTYLSNKVHGRKKGQVEEERQLIRSIIDTTTCSGALAEDEIKTVELDVDPNDVQITNYDDERLVTTTKNICRRLVRRQLGRNLTMRLVSMDTIYRPFYIAIYGEMVDGQKVRYLPIPADGNKVNRTL